jgi:hypothetical protein
MSMKSILNPDTSVLLGVANGAIIIGLYQQRLPSVASVRTADPHDNDIEQTRKSAAWMSAAFLAFMFLLTRDRNSFLIGGLVLAGTDLTVKHSNGLNPSTGKLEATQYESIGEEDIANVYPLPDYQDDAAEGY